MLAMLSHLAAPAITLRPFLMGSRAVDPTSTATPEIPLAGSSEADAAQSRGAPRAEDELEISPEAQQYGEQQYGELSEEQRAQVDELKNRDREVRQHEQAHLAAAGPHAISGPTYDYQKGPDGKKYAVGGEVQIDTSPVDGDPEATIRKARIVRAAALAPAEPSSQDRAVAAKATQMEMSARADAREQEAAEPSETPGQSTSTENAPAGGNQAPATGPAESAAKAERTDATSSTNRAAAENRGPIAAGPSSSQALQATQALQRQIQTPPRGRILDRVA